MGDGIQHYSQNEHQIIGWYDGNREDLTPGAAFCFDFDNTTTGTADFTYDQRVFHVEQPSATNLKWFAGVLLEQNNGQTGPGPVYLGDPSVIVQGLNLLVENTVAAGDVLSIRPGSWAFCKGQLYLEAPVVARVIEITAGTPTAPLPCLCRYGYLTDYVRADEMVIVYTDFWSDTGGGILTADAGATGGQAIVADSKIGEYAMYTDGDAEDEAYLRWPQNFALTGDNPLRMHARIKLTESTTDDINFICGLSDQAAAADLILDSAGGPQAAGDHFSVWKPEDDLTLQVESMSAGATTAVDTDIGEVVSAAYFTIEFYYDGVSKIYVYKDGVLVATHAATMPVGTDLQLGIGLKTKGAGEELCTFDKVLCVQHR